METIRLKGYVSKDGELHVQLPSGIPEGQIDVVLEIDRLEDESASEPAWTEAEIAEMIRPDPKTGAEIVALGHTGGWEHLGITDSLTWVEAQRRKRRAKRGW